MVTLCCGCGAVVKLCFAVVEFGTELVKYSIEALGHRVAWQWQGTMCVAMAMSRIAKARRCDEGTAMARR